MTEQGNVLLSTFESIVLKSNPLKDPYKRKLAIYLPPGYEKSNASYPVVFLLAGFAGKGYMMLNAEAFSESIDQRLDRLISEGKMKPMIVVMPDCFTYYGGSQYRDSAAQGQYETHVMKELVPHIQHHYRVKEEASSWAVAGKSSGGYAALALAMHHPDIFGISVCHSGDLGFEYCYLPDFPEAMMTLQKCGGIAAFMKKFYALPKKDGNHFLTLNIVAMAASYSPDINNAPHYIDLPFDWETGEVRPAVWDKWLACDPLRMIESHEKALRQLKLFVDCGTRDEYRLYAGARMFSAKLKGLGIAHTYEEFDDNHRQLSYRYDQSFQFISNSMT